jgi:crotonobetainyl-CoA:carnitine CoA-transferase CaiB-like acyl-CoA transferase
MSPGALAGIRVIDMSSLYAAPLAASILADFGADVIKIEPPGGDPFRGTRMWPLVARNKRCVSLDLRSPDGREALKRLAARADVVVENYPARVLADRGLGWDVLSAANPRLVMLSLSCFGASGPYQDRPGSGTIGEAFGGLTFLTGESDGPPMLPSVALGDAVGAMSAALGVLAALQARSRTGRGQQVDASLYEPILHIVVHAGQRWSPGQPPTRSGSKLPGVLRNVFRTADGEHVAISASTPRHQRDLVALAGGKSGTDDEDALVADWIATVPRSELIERLVARRIPVTPVNDLDTLFGDPQVLARESLVRQSDPELGELVYAAPTPRLSLTPGRIEQVNPPLLPAIEPLLAEWEQPRMTGELS